MLTADLFLLLSSNVVSDEDGGCNEDAEISIKFTILKETNIRIVIIVTLSCNLNMNMITKKKFSLKLQV